MAFQAKIVVDGLKDLNKALKTHTKEVRKEVRDKFKNVGEIIAAQARRNAARNTKEHSGDLVRKIKPSLIMRGVKITASARAKSSKRYPQGYNYPGRIEWRGHQNPARTAFLFPALEEKSDEALDELEQVFDWLERTWLVNK